MTAFAGLSDLQQAMEDTPFTAYGVINRGIRALTILKNIRSVRGLKRLSLLIQVRSDLRFLRGLSQVNPGNFLALYLMVRGEWYLYRRKDKKAIAHFKDAVQAAKQSEFRLYEGLANELLANAFFAQSLDKVGLSFIREALFVYENWGAKAKAKQLHARYPELHRLALQNESPRISHQSLDLDTVLKATNTLISEMNMNRLVQKLLDILLENAGAERAILMLPDDQQFVVCGELIAKSGRQFAALNIPSERFSNLPHSMIAYVARTHETVVLDDAAADDRFGRDEYIQREQIFSTVCLPILSKNDLKGLVYLENNSAKGVFSAERMELMRVLSGQIAISIENARLYQKQAETIRMQAELKTAQAVQEMLLPKTQAQFANVDVAGHYAPATECGGDWWHHSQIGDWVYIWVGDATGHGAPAALVTSAACSAVALIEKRKNMTPELAMELLNHAVYSTTKGQITMTFFIGALNTQSGEFRYVRAAHDAPFVLRQGTKFERLKPGGLQDGVEYLNGEICCPLGDSPDESFAGNSIWLNSGDTVVLYSDGLTEMIDGDDHPWGERSFLTAVREALNNERPLPEQIQSVIARANAFRGEAELRDDITLCFVKYTGAAEEKAVA